MKRFLTTLALALTILVAAPVSAQTQANSVDTPTVEIVAPAGWKRSTLSEDDVRIAAFIDPKTSNSIEVIGKQVIRSEHIESLYDAFDKQLQNASLQKNESASVPNKEFVLVDGTKRSGRWNEYTYTTSDIKIIVADYLFESQNFVVIVVGYFSAAEYDKGIESMTEFIKTLTDKEDATAN